MSSRKKSTKPLSAAPPKAAAPRSFQRLPWRVVVFGLGFLLYANTLTHRYALDDAIVITENDFVKKGFAGWGDIFAHDTFLGFFKTERNLVAGGRYRPLSLATFAAEHQVAGENPALSHLLNALLFALTGVWLYLLVAELFSQRLAAEQAHWVALATALLFVAHPIHTEAVANIKGRDEILSLLGSLAAFRLLLRWTDKPQPADLLFAALAFAAALFSKENAITFIAIIPAGLWVFRKSASVRSLALTTGLLVAVAVFFLAVRSAALGDAAQLNTAVPQELMNNPFLGLSTADKYATIFYTLGKYLVLLVFPHPLTHDYYPFHIPPMSFGNLGVWLSVVGHLALGLFAVARLPKRDPFAFAVIFYLASLSIVSNLVFPVGTNMSERFLYMPSVGYCLAAGWALAQKPLSRRVAVGVLGAAFLLMGAKTVWRNAAWKDNFTLFSTDIQTSVNSAKLNNAMGGILIDQANLPENAAQRDALLTNAIGHLQKALELHPTYTNAYLLLGNAYIYLADYPRAITYYDFVLQQKPDDVVQNTAFVLQEGIRHADRREFDKALNAFALVVRYQPANAEAFGRMGMIHGLRGNADQAIAALQKAYDIAPDNPDVCYNLGVALAASPAQALPYLERAVALQPENANFHQVISSLYRAVGQLQKADVHAQRAADLQR